MNTDRDLLEAAAKTAGLHVDMRSTIPDYLWVREIKLHGPYRTWNPLTDDADALRLAVKLRIEIEPWIHGDSACARAAVGEILTDEPHYGDDPGRATRRAIVRAAAAMVAG